MGVGPWVASNSIANEPISTFSVNCSTVVDSEIKISNYYIWCCAFNEFATHCYERQQNEHKCRGKYLEETVRVFVLLINGCGLGVF